MILLIFYLALALGVSFLCSILEAVLLSITPTYVVTKTAENEKVGARLHALKDDIDRPLAAILSLNTVAHTIGAAGVGAQAQLVFGDAYVTATSIVLTLLILFLSEIIPKTLGARFWKSLAPWAAKFLPWLIVSMAPLVWISRWIARLLSKEEQGPTLSREEFHALADMGAREGIFDEKESRVLRNLLRFGKLQAKDIMTPRTVVLGFDETDTVASVIEHITELRFSRYPVYEDDLDEVTGYVLKHDLLLAYAHGQMDRALSDFRRDILVLPALARVADILEQLLQRKEHLALLVGEYGGTAGIVTLEDIVETLLGLEIVDEMDEVEDMQAMARQQWYKRAKILGILPEEEGGDPSLKASDVNAARDRVPSAAAEPAEQPERPGSHKAPKKPRPE